MTLPITPFSRFSRETKRGGQKGGNFGLTSFMAKKGKRCKGVIVQSINLLESSDGPERQLPCLAVAARTRFSGL